MCDTVTVWHCVCVSVANVNALNRSLNAFLLTISNIYLASPPFLHLPPIVEEAAVSCEQQLSSFLTMRKRDNFQSISRTQL